MQDFYLMCVLEVLLLVASVLQILLAEKKKQPRSLGWKVQAFVFPAMLLVGLVLYTQGKDYIFPLVMLGLVEELVCWGIRQKQKQEPENKEE